MTARRNASAIRTVTEAPSLSGRKKSGAVSEIVDSDTAPCADFICWDGLFSATAGRVTAVGSAVATAVVAAA